MKPLNYLTVSCYCVNLAYPLHHFHVLTGTYEVLVFEVTFQRKVANKLAGTSTALLELIITRGIAFSIFIYLHFLYEHFIGVYLPSALQVFASFLTFWFGFDTTSERVTVGINSLLGIVGTFAEVKASLPPTSHINVLDKWMVACILFITFQMIEATIVDFLYDRFKNQMLLLKETNERNRELRAQGLLVEDEEEAPRPQTVERRRNRLERRMIAEKGDGKISHKTKKRNVVLRAFRKYFKVKVQQGEPAYYPLKIDAISRILFPGAFIAFCIYYWPTLFA